MPSVVGDVGRTLNYNRAQKAASVRVRAPVERPQWRLYPCFVWVNDGYLVSNRERKTPLGDSAKKTSSNAGTRLGANFDSGSRSLSVAQTGAHLAAGEGPSRRAVTSLPRREGARYPLRVSTVNSP